MIDWLNDRARSIIFHDNLVCIVLIFDFLQTWDLFVDMLLALQHLHTHHLVHMDVKPDNIFLTIDTPTIYKLGDFGIVVCLEEKVCVTVNL